MDLIDMAGEVFFVADTMFPIPPLPNCLFPLALPAGEYDRALGGWYARGERALDVAPPNRIIRFPLR